MPWGEPDGRATVAEGLALVACGLARARCRRSASERRYMGVWRSMWGRTRCKRSASSRASSSAVRSTVVRSMAPTHPDTEPPASAWHSCTCTWVAALRRASAALDTGGVVEVPPGGDGRNPELRVGAAAVPGLVLAWASEVRGVGCQALSVPAVGGDGEGDGRDRPCTVSTSVVDGASPRCGSTIG